MANLAGAINLNFVGVESLSFLRQPRHPCWSIIALRFQFNVVHTHNLEARSRSGGFFFPEIEADWHRISAGTLTLVWLWGGRRYLYLLSTALAFFSNLTSVTPTRKSARSSSPSKEYSPDLYVASSSCSRDFPPSTASSPHRDLAE
jgi:hypothetical protein